MKSGAFVDWISAWCMPLHALSMLYKCLNVYRQDVNAGQSGRPSYPGGLATATASLGNVGSTPHSSADLRVGTAVALASSVAKYWVLTNLFPGPLPQVSVYHHSHHNSSHRSGGGGEASSSKEPASSLNQEMALTSSSHHQQQSTAAHHHHQSSVSSSSHHSSLQSNPQVCLCVAARVLCNDDGLNATYGLLRSGVLGIFTGIVKNVYAIFFGKKKKRLKRRKCKLMKNKMLECRHS